MDDEWRDDGGMDGGADRGQASCGWFFSLIKGGDITGSWSVLKGRGYLAGSGRGLYLALYHWLFSSAGPAM